MSTSCCVRRSDRPKLCAVALGVVALLTWSGGARAQAAAATAAQAASLNTYAMEPAPLGQTLDAISRLSGQRIRYDDAAVKGLMAAPVSGALTARQAVEQALKGTSLHAGNGAAGTLEVGAALMLDSIMIVATRDPAETSFKADRSDTATRSGTDLLDVPQAVTIITSKVLETQQALSVRDALANASGVAFTQSPQGSPSFSIRGYNLTASTVNGVNDTSATLTNVFTVERIEVLKGPQAILAGSDALGGGVNVVTKKPQAAPIGSLLLQYGSHGDATIAGDLAGALTEDKKLSYRLIASEAKARDNDAGFDGRKDASVLPQLRWKDATTDLIVGLSYGKQRQPVPAYTFARRDGLILPEPDIRQGQSDDGFDTSQKRAFYQLEQKLGQHITFVSRLQRSNSDLNLHLYSPGGLSYDRGATPDTPNGKVSYFPGISTRSEKNTSGDHYLRIEGNTGPIGHKLSLGVNHTNDSYHQVDMSGDGVEPAVYPPDTTFTFPNLASRANVLSLIADSRSAQVGYFFQDLMSWGDWNALINLRHTKFDVTNTANFVEFGFVSDQPKTKISANTPGLGLVYKLTPEASLYASYAQGFSPQVTPRCGGGLLPPVATRNRELGAKFDLLGNKLSLTTAAFELAQSNTIFYDPIQDCDNVRSSQVTRGLEADLQGNLAAGWSITTNYTFNTLKDVGDSTTIFPGLSKHKLSVWTIYELQNIAWKGWGLGMGLTANSSSDGSFSPDDHLKIPGHAQFDASVFYQRDKWNVIFGVKNIGDRLLYAPATSSSYIPILPRRTFMLTVKRDFV